ncbi:hypothetical protein B9L19_03380 [Geobacillus thermocatenulatus]|uniref:Uncharacterized protein n=1 Tax=Geobacillus thermocatenulatus TaxID=33938 RepID=A0AA91TEM0_9BACL|nr:hypothetical protein B9L19_03380 [Geobacillus thermocatenulatus]
MLCRFLPFFSEKSSQYGRYRAVRRFAFVYDKVYQKSGTMRKHLVNQGCLRGERMTCPTCFSMINRWSFCRNSLWRSG